MTAADILCAAILLIVAVLLCLWASWMKEQAEGECDALEQANRDYVNRPRLDGELFIGSQK